jgi:hypothetical protein
LHSVIEDIITEEKSNIFEPDVIKAGFRHTGIWPFDISLIREKFQNMYEFNTKPQLHTSEDEEAKAMTLIFKEVLMPQQTKTPTKRVTAAERGKLVTGRQLLDYANEKEEKALKEKEVKELAKKEREDKKRKREEDKEERQKIVKQRKLDKESSVVERTCSFCRHMYTKKHKFWVCDSCNTYQVCSKCQQQDTLDEHAAECGSDLSDKESDLSRDEEELDD